jgi:hypothetical protein
MGGGFRLRVISLGAQMKSTGFIHTLAGFLTCLFLATLFASQASEAGQVSLFLTIDPATTAGYGVLPAGGFSVSSNRSGPGTWHLFAIDDATNSFGIAQVKAQLIGTVPAINNRLTQTRYDTDDNSGFKAGFTLLRSATNANPIIGSAELAGTQPFLQTGLGISAGSYNSIPGARAFSGTTNGQWGNYADVDPTYLALTGHMRNALFIAEGTYTGVAPVVDLANSFVAYYTNATSGASLQATVFGPNPLVNTIPCLCYPKQLVLADAAIDNVNANSPGSLTHTFDYSTSLPNPDAPPTWSNFQFVSYVPDAGASGSGPVLPATFDPSQHRFDWTTLNSPRGVYTWEVSASKQGYSDTAYLHVHITAVPEPATIVLLAFAWCVSLGNARLRSKAAVLANFRRTSKLGEVPAIVATPPSGGVTFPTANDL